MTLCLIDSPSKLDDIALAAIRAADMVVCPTLPDLFSLGSLQDTVQLLEVAGKLPVTVGVINNVDKPYVPPSRKNRKFFTTWIDKAALKELRDL